MDKILFATDFSECSKNAFIYALHTAKITKSKLDIVTVSKPYNPKSDIIKKQLEELILNNKEYILENKIQYQTHLKLGTTSSVINEYINSTKPGLVIIGSRGRNEVTGSSELLGGNAKKIISNSTVPVISIPTHIKFKSIKNIVFITNRLEEDYFAIIQLLKFASLYNTKVVLAHINDNQGAAEEKFNEFYNDLSELLNYENFEFKYLSKESYVEGINKLIKENEAEVLSLVYEKQNFFERLFNSNYVSKLLVNDYIPLLTLPS